MHWKAPTLHTHLAADPGARTHARVVELTESGNHSCICDCCGRTTAADMLVDVRALPAGIRKQVGLEADADFVCDGCRERWFREARIPRAVFWQALGAPADTIARIRQFARSKGEKNHDATA